MKTDRLAKILERVENWPTYARDELAEIAQEIDAGLGDTVYEPSAGELEGIDRGLRDAAQGRFATDEEIAAVFAKFRGK
jgi:predicted transcriptional regulator